MVKLHRKLCEGPWWGERGKSLPTVFYMAEVGGRVFRGCEWFYMSVGD